MVSGSGSPQSSVLAGKSTAARVSFRWWRLDFRSASHLSSRMSLTEPAHGSPGHCGDRASVKT